MSTEKTAPAIAVTLAFDRIKVLFGGTIHLSLRRSKLLGLQSWRYGESNYFIEFTMAGGGVITSEYDDVEKWKVILAGLDSIL